MRKYTVIFEPGPRNWSAYVPDLPGCIATGRTRAVTQQRMREAIRFHIEGMRLVGERIPKPTTQAGVIAVPA